MIVAKICSACFSVPLSWTWNEILRDKKHHLVTNEIDKARISSSICVILYNRPRCDCPYVVIENVAISKYYWHKKHIVEYFTYAWENAAEQYCKIMLLISAKDLRTLNFYQHRGYNYVLISGSGECCCVLTSVFLLVLPAGLHLSTYKFF